MPKTIFTEFIDITNYKYIEECFDKHKAYSQDDKKELLIEESIIEEMRKIEKFFRCVVFPTYLKNYDFSLTLIKYICDAEKNEPLSSKLVLLDDLLFRNGFFDMKIIGTRYNINDKNFRLGFSITLFFKNYRKEKYAVSISFYTEKKRYRMSISEISFEG